MPNPMTNPTGKHRRKRRHHGEGTVVHRKDKWRAKPWAAVVPYYDPSGRRREMWLSAGSRDEADDLRKRELDKLRKGVKPTTHTVRSYVEDWLMTYEMGPTTFERYRHHVRERIVPTLGDLRLTELDPTKVRGALGRWEGSPSTRGGTLRILRMAMRRAVADGLLPDDPTKGVKAPTIHEEVPIVLDAGEAKHLRAVVRKGSWDPVLYPLLTVALGLGLRRGEALGLRTPDVDFAKRTIYIGHSLRRVPVPTRGTDDHEWWRLVEAKAGSEATLPLPTFVAAALRERIDERDSARRRTKVWAPNDFIFCDAHGNPVSFSNLTRWFGEALKAAKLPDMRWHYLRASTAVILLEEGIDELTVMRILRHRNLQMTRKYTKLTDRLGRRAADALDGAMGG